jgi:hypothetical protein
MSDGQKLGQRRRSKRILGKQTRIQDMDVADFKEDIFDDSRSSSEDGKAGQTNCFLFEKSLRWIVI